MTHTYFFAASGSGGHLLPALHVANALRALDSESAIHFIGAGRPLEHELVAPHFPLHVVAAARIMQQGWRGPFALAKTFPTAWSQLSGLFATHQPNVVIGVGGYASVLPVLFAWKAGVPRIIHEAERDPGLANRVLAPIASVVSVARDECHIWGTKDRLYAGQPMRPDIVSVPPCNPEQPRSLLVMGGSQGAAALDRAAPQLASLARRYNLSVTHQTRRDAVEKVRSVYEQAQVQAQVVEFLRDMPAVYASTDLVVSRAGANTVAELEIVGRPTIFVPYPHAQGGHQSENAAALVRDGQAVICEELIPTSGTEAFEVRLQTALGAIVSNSDRYRSMRRDPRQTRNSNAALTIARRILALANLRRHH